MDEPKIILKIELIGDKSFQVTLLNVHYSLSDNFKVNHHKSKNGWYMVFGDKFQILKGLTIFPDIVNQDVYNLELSSENERYEYLKGFSEALLSLSKCESFKNIANFSTEPLIRPQGNMWLVY